MPVSCILHFLNNTDKNVSETKKSETRTPYTTTSNDRKDEPRWDDSTDHSLKIPQAGPFLNLVRVNMTAEDEPIHICRMQQMFMLPYKRELPVDF